MRRPQLFILALLLAGAAGLVALTFFGKAKAPAAPSTAARLPATGGASNRPTAPPGPGDPRPRFREPQNPVVSNAWKAEMTEKLRNSDRPGEAAFSAYADRFVDENLDLAQQQADAEGLTLPEVRALTRLGLLVMATQRTTDVEEVLGRELSPETKDALEQVVQEENGAFKEKIRAMVATRAPEAERWEVISAADARFRERFFKVSGMTAQQLDDMLAGNLLLPGAPGANPDPAALGGDATPRGPVDTAAPAPRPEVDPR